MHHLKWFCTWVLVWSFYCPLKGQVFIQYVKGSVRDQETLQPVGNATMLFTRQTDTITFVSDTNGNFIVRIPSGRWNLLVSRLGYESGTTRDIQVGTGKEVVLDIMLEAKVYQAREVQVSAGRQTWLAPSGGSSVRTLRSQDAGRFAGGYYDPLRMVANFAGVTSGNSDETNAIVVRGNSPRGLLWRLEGLEIPDPNHLNNGVGNNGGAYSMISTNALADFDFYSGAFPAEFGNALSGVMDLRLRKGNMDKLEFGIMLSEVGAEVSAEGPVSKSNGSSFLFNFRYANFNVLKRYGIISIRDLSIIPGSLDWTFRMNFHTAHLGDLELFSIGGKSKTGNEASQNLEDLRNGINNDEFLEDDRLSVFGIRQLKYLRDGKTYIRTILGFTRANNNWHEGIVDTNRLYILNRQDWFISPVIRASVMVNHKVNTKNSFRTGVEYHRTFADMFSIRRQSAQNMDTLVDQRSQSFYTQSYFQWKYKPADYVELVPAIHSTYTSVNRELTFEPRLGIIFTFRGNQSLNIGTGIYSRQEPLPIYFFRVKAGNLPRSTVNSDLLTTKAFHLVVGYRRSFSDDLRVSLEGYYQHLYDVPVSVSSSNTFSMVNVAEGMPDIDMNNRGKSGNTGLELTIDKSYSHNYYVLVTFSLFDSKYMASSTKWYSTYYNSNYVFNLVGGREFKVGKYKQNTLGFNLRNMARGGYRFTPPDYVQSIKRKSLVYDVARTYGRHLPFYDRTDLGINYRINRQKSAFNFSLDIQNVLARHNVYQRKFSYLKGTIVQTDKRLIGIIPIAGLRFDF